MPKFAPILTFVKKHAFVCALAALVLLYLLLRLINLTLLPVFADEAIYIYWSQLTLSDWQQFLFYPLNDGKTPLFIWLMMPAIKLFADPLFAGRFVNVLFGLGQLYFTAKIVSLFTPRKRYQLLAAVAVIFCPGLILNNRLALMDTMSTFFVSGCFYFTYRSLQLAFAQKSWLQYCRRAWPSVLAATFFFGFGLLTKLSNLLLLPVLATLLLYFFPWQKWRQAATYHALILPILTLAFIAGGGLGCLALLKISPAFGQLFARGGDFLHPLNEFFAQPFKIITDNTILFLQVLANYLGGLFFGVTIFLALGLAWQKRFWPPLWLILSGLAYATPILLLGKIIYPRYFLPVLPFFLCSFLVSLSRLRRRDFFGFKLILFVLILLNGFYFTFYSLTTPEKMPLTPQDQSQLFTEWSSGHGIKESVALIADISRSTKTLVLTEGYFGTLPDGLQIYFWKNPARNQIRIEGAGQPIANLKHVQDLINQYQQVLLVVNSYRLQPDADFILPELLAEYPRPLPDSPSLQVWRVK